MRSFFAVFLGLMAVSNASRRGPFRPVVELPWTLSSSSVESNALKVGNDTRLMNSSTTHGIDPDKFKRHVFILSEICPIQPRNMTFGDEIIVESQHPFERFYRTGVSCSTNFTGINGGGIILVLLDSQTADCNDYMKISSLTEGPITFCGNGNETGTSIIYDNDNLEVTWHTETAAGVENKAGTGLRILLTAYQTECREGQPCFQCENGLYIDQFHMCNGWNNCGDGSDEVNCPPFHFPKCNKSNRGHGWLITMSVLFVVACLVAGVLAFMNYNMNRRNRDASASGAESGSFLPDFLRRMF